MKVLVSAASRHGATAEIARAIGETLTEAGLGIVRELPALGRIVLSRPSSQRTR